MYRTQHRALSSFCTLRWWMMKVLIVPTLISGVLLVLTSFRSTSVVRRTRSSARFFVFSLRFGAAKNVPCQSQQHPLLLPFLLPSQLLRLRRGRRRLGLWGGCVLCRRSLLRSPPLGVGHEDPELHRVLHAAGLGVGVRADAGFGKGVVDLHVSVRHGTSLLTDQIILKIKLWQQQVFTIKFVIVSRNQLLLLTSIEL